jgi:Flp pilus assembly protein TadG
MLIVGGIIQFGLIFWAQNTLTQVVRDTGRWAASQQACTPAEKTLIIATANNIAAKSSLFGYTSAWPSSSIDIDWPTTNSAGVTYDGDGNGVLDPCPPTSNQHQRWVTITIRHQVPIFFPLVPGNANLASSTQFRMEPVSAP